ncbi:AAA family ATPase [Pseudomonas qingdaonensis]|uniref:AAA family ATPase n=1 Tax=Pseudomonas qingdaonensis TaxID=2056231 RepID=UPI0012FDDE53|nr:AAA family ATPase [Pseudomonas qingdaonensis]
MSNAIFDFENIPLIIPDLYDRHSNSYSILVGSNGVGKSRLLSSMSAMLAERSRNNPDDYSWRYFDAFSNGGNPKIITVSTSPFDTFKLPKNDGPYDPTHSNYRYVGMRGMGSMSSGSISLISSAATGLLDKLQSRQGLQKLAHVFRVLNFDPRMDFVFKPLFQRKNINRPIDEADFTISSDLIRYLEDKYDLKFEARGASALADLSSEEFEQVDNALKYYAGFYLERKHFLLTVGYENVYEYGRDWAYSFSGELRGNEHLLACTITLLRNGLIKLMDLRLAKADNYDFSLRRASSGEQCMLVIMLGIAGHITDNSQIFIDEPEISLHPRWQERFMSLIIDVFSDYTRCSFYIATHSPQIISKLSEKNCFITSLTRREVYSAENFREKSADYQLAELFDAPGSMNEYVVRLAFKTMSSLSNRKEVTRETYSDLIKLRGFSEKINKYDPLHELINSALKMGEHYAINHKSR